MKTRSQIAIEALDEAARYCEAKWGVDRLPKLVSVDLAERFDRQLKKLNHAIDEECTGGSIANVEYEAGRMFNAWMALDAAAEAAGAVLLDGAWMAARMADGRSMVICRDLESAQFWRQQNPDQAAALWTLPEIVHVLEGFDLVNRTKHIFEGAVVEDARASNRVNWARGDELPDDMRLSVLGAG
jgi:hypothetical protein